MGHDLPPPRLTAAGWRLAALWLAPAAFGIVVMADLLGWVVIKAISNQCFGLVCLLG
jgi:hypothetical protein